MSSSKFDSMWRLMSVYAFEIDPKLVKDDMLCFICHRLLKDAFQSVCGCIYCHQCIRNYLREGPRHCPGGKEKCKEEYLSLDADVLRNVRMNDRISKLKAMCPNDACQTLTDLAMMDSHLRQCAKRPTICPYVPIGCNNDRMAADVMPKHMNAETMTHTNLLFEWITDLKNEVGRLKDNFVAINVKFESIQKDSMLKDKLLEEQGKEIETFQKEFRKKGLSMDEEVRRLSYRMDIRLSALKEGRRVDEISMLGHRREAESTNELGKLEKETLSRKMDYLILELKGMKENRRNSVIECENFTRRSSRFSDKRNRTDIEEVRTRHSFLALDDNIDMNYVWRIYEWATRKEVVDMKPIFSEPFYLSGYKMCLRIYIDGDYVGLFCFIMKGQNDDNLDWPMKRVVTLSVINQETLSAHQSVSFHYDFYGREKSAFNRPKLGMNYYCIGLYPFILKSSLDSTPFISVNDSIVVSCVLGEPR